MLKYTVDKGPDGHSSWENFRLEVSTNEPCPRDIHTGKTLNKGVPCAIRVKNGGEIVLYPDGTWDYDCAPDWDGSS